MTRRDALFPVALQGMVLGAMTLSAAPASAQVIANCEETCCMCEDVQYPCEWDPGLQAWVCPWEFGCEDEYYEDGYKECLTWQEGGYLYCEASGDMCIGDLLVIPPHAIDDLPGLEITLPCAPKDPSDPHAAPVVVTAPQYNSGRAVHFRHRYQRTDSFARDRSDRARR